MKKAKVSGETVRVRLDKDVAEVYLRASKACELPLEDVLRVVLALHVAAQREAGK
jgi:hypothetical protein